MSFVLLINKLNMLFIPTLPVKVEFTVMLSTEQYWEWWAMLRMIVPCCWKVFAQKWRIGKTKFICRERDFHFPRSGLPAKVWQLSSRGRRPRLDSQTEAGQSRSRKMETLSRSMNWVWEILHFRCNYFQAAWIYFLCFLSDSMPKMRSQF